MSKVLWKSLLFSPAILGAALVVSSSAIAAPTSKTAPVQSSSVGAQKQQDVVVATTATNLEPTVAMTPTTEISQKEDINSVVVTSQELAVEPALTIAQAATTTTAETSVDTLEQLNRYSNEGKSADSIAQVTSVSHISDVQPTDWAFQAL